MELWTGLVCLVVDPACQNFKRFDDGKGANVYVVAWAEFQVHIHAVSLGLSDFVIINIFRLGKNLSSPRIRL